MTGAVFFFLKRCEIEEDDAGRQREKQSGGQSGVHVMVRATIEEIRDISQKGTALVNPSTRVTILRSPKDLGK